MDENKGYPNKIYPLKLKCQEDKRINKTNSVGQCNSVGVKGLGNYSYRMDKDNFNAFEKLQEQ